MSARTVPRLVPAALSKVPDRVLARFWITTPALMKPPSKQCPLVSISARSVSTEDGYLTSEAEQLLRAMVEARLAAWILGAAAAGELGASTTLPEHRTR